MARGQYQTKQKEAVLACLQSAQGKPLTAAQVTRMLYERGQTVGAATVYRQLDKLVEQGLVKCYKADGTSAACYQLTGGGHGCEHHFHLKCDGCGDLLHLECDALQELKEHLAQDHLFSVDINRTVLYGTCARCKQAKGTPP